MREIFRIALVAIICLASTVSARTAKVEPILNRISLPLNRTPSGFCELWNHGDTIAADYSRIVAGERYAVLIDPAKCATSPQFPWNIKTVWLTFFTFLGSKWPVNIDLEIWSAKGGIPCQGPGGMLYSEARILDQSTYSLPSLGRFTLAQPVCVDGPFFVAIRYTGQTPAPYPSILFDSRMPADSCVNWGYGPTTFWENWWHFWNPPVPGNIIIWVDGETNSPTCVNAPCCNGTAGNVDCDQFEQVDISDLSRLIDYLYVSFQPLCCIAEANIDGVTGTDISDLSALIDNLYISFRPIVQCQ